MGMFLISMETSVWIASFYNVVRCMAIGCLMMPLVTWGTSKLNYEAMAHATALLTSLRTISGAIGSAIFVGIMTTVTQNSMVTYGENASIHGLNMTFLAMAGGSIVLLLVAVFGVKKTAKIH